MPTLHRPSDQPYSNFSSGYGSRKSPTTGASTFHQGIDYGWGNGWNVFSALDGTVESVAYSPGYNGGWGGRMVINHGNGIKTTYNHLNRNSNIGIRAGQRVSRGQRIAVIGNPTTGASSGPHLHFELYIDGSRVNPYPYFTQNVPRVSSGGSGAVSGTQRVAGPNGVRRRTQPSSKSAEAGELLAPGTVGNFVGWVHGESVDGNDVWFKGTSGNWFWSGGFTSTSTAGLTNLNPVKVTATQRVVGPNGVKRRIGAPSISATVGQGLDAGTIGNFTGWVSGDSVEGNNVWFVGISGDYFWSGGFLSTSTTGLTDMNKAVNPTSTERTVKSDNSVHGRKAPYRSAESVQMLAAGATGNFKGYVEGESVEGNNIWFVGAIQGNYFWSGAFTSASKTGLEKLEAPKAPETPKPSEDPKEPTTPAVEPAKKRTAVLPFAKEGWDTPRGREAREKNPETSKIAITHLAVHHTGSTANQEAYFKAAGNGSVPTWYVNGKDIFEYTRPGLRPVATAKNNNWSVAIETQNTTNESGGWQVSQDSIESIAQIAAWLASYDGNQLDGVDVAFKLDRGHIKGHQEFPGNSTLCPGPFLLAQLDAIVERAKEIYADKYAPKPIPEPEPQPEEPTVPEGMVQVSKSTLSKMLIEVEALKIVLSNLLGDKKND